MVEKKAKIITETRRKTSFGIADLGCAFGPNAWKVVTDVLDTVVTKCHELDLCFPQFQIFLNDLHSSDFNAVFRSLPEALLHEQVQCYLAGVPGSFYERLFPNGGVDFCHSSSSIHELSQNSMAFLRHGKSVRALSPIQGGSKGSHIDSLWGTVICSNPSLNIYEDSDLPELSDIMMTSLATHKRVDQVKLHPGGWKHVSVERSLAGDEPYLNPSSIHPTRLEGRDLLIECLRELFDKGLKQGWYGQIEVRGMPKSYVGQVEWTNYVLTCFVWKLRALGLYDAIYASLFSYHQYGSLLQSFIEHWIPRYNTAFTWEGEFSPNLWDFSQLMGLPISGDFDEECFLTNEVLYQKDNHRAYLYPYSVRFLLKVYRNLALWTKQHASERKQKTRIVINPQLSMRGIDCKMPLHFPDVSSDGKKDLPIPIDAWICFFYGGPFLCEDFLRLGKQLPVILEDHNVILPTDGISYIPLPLVGPNPWGLYGETYLCAFLAFWFSTFALPYASKGCLWPGMIYPSGLLSSRVRLAICPVALSNLFFCLGMIHHHPILKQCWVVMSVHHLSCLMASYMSLFVTSNVEAQGKRPRMLAYVDIEVSVSLQRARHFFNKFPTSKDQNIEWRILSPNSPASAMIQELFDDRVQASRHLILGKPHPMSDWLLHIRPSILIFSIGHSLISEPYYPHRFSWMFGCDQGVPPERTQFQLICRCHTYLYKQELVHRYWNLYYGCNSERIYIPFLTREEVFSDRYGGWWSRRTNSFLLNYLDSHILREKSWILKHGNINYVSSRYIKAHRLHPKSLTKEREARALKVNSCYGYDLYPPKEWSTFFLEQLRWKPHSELSQPSSSNFQLFSDLSYLEGYRWVDLLFSLLSQASQNWLSMDLPEVFLDGSYFFSTSHIYASVKHNEDFRIVVLRAEIVSDIVEVVKSSSHRDGVSWETYVPLSPLPTYDPPMLLTATRKFAPKITPSHDNHAPMSRKRRTRQSVEESVFKWATTDLADMVPDCKLVLTKVINLDSSSLGPSRSPITTDIVVYAPLLTHFALKYLEDYRWVDISCTVIGTSLSSWDDADILESFISGESFFNSSHIWEAIKHHPNLSSILPEARTVKQLLFIIQMTSQRDGVAWDTYVPCPGPLLHAPPMFVTGNPIIVNSPPSSFADTDMEFSDEDHLNDLEDLFREFLDVDSDYSSLPANASNLSSPGLTRRSFPIAQGHSNVLEMSCLIQDSPCLSFESTRVSHGLTKVVDLQESTQYLDIGIPVDYVPLPEPKPYHLRMMKSIIEGFKDAVSSDFSIKDLLEFIQDTSRLLVSMKLPLENWNACALSLLRLWQDRRQRVSNEAVLRQCLSVVDLSISSLTERCATLAKEMAELDVQMVEAADKASVAKQQLIEYEARVKQASEDLEKYTFLFGTLEQSRSDKVAEHAHEVEDLASARATLMNLKIKLDGPGTYHDNIFVEEYKAILDNFIP